MSRDTLNYTHGDQGLKPTDASQFESNQRPDSEQFDWFWYNVTEALSGHADEFDRIDGDDDGVVDGADGASTYSDDGTTRVVRPTDIDFLDKLNVSDDGDGTVSIDTSALDQEEVEDTVSNLLSAGSNLSWTYDDSTDTLTLNTTALNAEEVEDQVNALLSAGDKLSFTYDDAGDTLTIDTTALNESEVQTWVNNNADVPNADHADNADDADTVDGNHAHDFASASHEGDTNNPHNVTDSQTGAASALSNHAGDAAGHHAQEMHGSGIDGTYSAASGTMSGIINATDFTVGSGDTVTVDPAVSVLSIFATGKITVDGTIDGIGASNNTNSSDGAILPDVVGGAGGNNTHDKSDGGSGGNGDNSNFQTVKINSLQELINVAESNPVAPAGGAGGGAFGSTSVNEDKGDGEAGTAPGGGGAGASRDYTDPDPATGGGNGGAGGGLVILSAPVVEINGTVAVSGADGEDGTGCYPEHSTPDAGGGGGGGGSGGLVVIRARDYTNSGTIDVSGGIGGAGSHCYHNGGDGANGTDGYVIQL